MDNFGLKSVRITATLVALILSGLSATAVAKDAFVEAKSPVGITVFGDDVQFDWSLDHYSNPQTRFYIYSSEAVTADNPEGKTGPYYGSATEYTWTDHSYGYGWWWVNVYKDKFGGGCCRWYGQSSPKSFHHDFPDDWEGLNYKTIYQDNGRLLFFEVQQDYTIYIPEFFFDASKLPDQWESDYYPFGWSMHVSYPPLDWDFIHFSSGYLTIKQGYRWDGASYPCKNLGNASCIDDIPDVRSSLIHDSLYDLMRMGYLEHDKALSLFNEGYYNRLMADLVLYMVAVEDGKPLKDRSVNWPLRDEGAEPDHDSMRFWGAGATNDDSRLAEWKYHVSELAATPSDGRIDLAWQPANDAGKEPAAHYALTTPHPGYQVIRFPPRHFLQPILATVDSTATSFTDDEVTDGATYTYGLRRISTDLSEYPGTIYHELGLPYFTNFDDYSNIVEATAVNVAPAVDAGPDETIDEGGAFTSSGSFTDPGDDTWTATVSYGDGSGIMPLTLTGKEFDLGHTYGDDGVYTVTVTVTDSDGGEGSDTAQVTVLNVAPSVSVDSVDQPNPHFILPVVHTLTFKGSFTDPGWLDTHFSNWDFDDGTHLDGTLTEENIQPDSTGNSESQHAYAAAGVYQVILGVMDDDGGTGTADWEVTVLSPQDAVVTIDEYIQGLPGDAFKNNPGQRKNALSHKLAEVLALINAGAYQGAISKLNKDIRAKADASAGGQSNNDWIRLTGAQQDICQMIDDLAALLKTM